MSCKNLPAPKIDKISNLYYASPFKRGIIFEESIFDRTY